MEPTGDQSPRSDNQPPLPRSRPDAYGAPIQRRPPLSRGNASQPITRKPATLSSQSRPLQQQPEPPQQSVQSQPVQAQAVPAEPLAQQPADTQEADPVIQMPQPATLAPPVSPQAPQPTTPIAPRQQPPQPQPAPPAPATEPPVSSLKADFTPLQKKNGRRWLYPALAVLAIMVLGVGIFSYAKVLAAKNNPDTVMKDALSNALSITTLETATETPGSSVRAKFKLDRGNPVVNAVNEFQVAGGTITIEGYGSLKDSYVAYRQLPKNTPDAVNKRIKDSWIHVRQDGLLPKDVPSAIVRASDPRYQVFGPVIIGNFDGQTKEQLLDYIIKNKVYGYDPAKVTKEDVGEETMFVYPLKLDVGYLKIASQSAAVSIGLEPDETRLAVDAMESLRDATVTMYVRADDHTIARLVVVKDGKTTTIDLTGYNKTDVPGAPQTRLFWQSFVPLQNQIEALASLTKTQD